MGSQRKRRTETADGCFQRLHIAFGKRPTPDGIVAQYLFQRVNVLLGNEHTVIARLHWLRFVELSVAMVSDGLPDDAKLETEWRGAVFRPTPEGLLSDCFHDLGSLVDVEITLVVNDDWAEAFSHPRIAQGTARKVKLRVN